MGDSLLLAFVALGYILLSLRRATASPPTTARPEEGGPWPPITSTRTASKDSAAGGSP